MKPEKRNYYLKTLGSLLLDQVAGIYGYQRKRKGLN